jgi:hypothetical protein
MKTSHPFLAVMVSKKVLKYLFFLKQTPDAFLTKPIQFSKPNRAVPGSPLRAHGAQACLQQSLYRWAK